MPRNSKIIIHHDRTQHLNILSIIIISNLKLPYEQIKSNLKCSKKMIRHDLMCVTLDVVCKRQKARRCDKVQEKSIRNNGVLNSNAKRLLIAG